MNKKNLVILLIIILCGIGLSMFGKYLIVTNEPTYVKIQVDGSSAKHYKIGDKINLEESNFNMTSLEPISENDTIIKTNLNNGQKKIFASYYSIYYGMSDQLNIESGIRLENNEIIINATDSTENNQLMIIDNKKNEILAVIDLD